MNTPNSFSASDKTTCRDLFCGIFFLGDCKKLSVTYCNCFCFMGVSVVGWFCDSNFWLLKQPIIRSYFGWTLTPQKMEMWWTCEIFLKCVGLRIYIIYIYTVYYTYIFQISDNYAKNWYKVRVVQEYHRRHGRCWPRTSTSPTTRSHGGWQKIMGAVKWERCWVFFDALLTLVGDTLLLAMDSNDFRFHQFSSFFKNMFVAI